MTSVQYIHYNYPSDKLFDNYDNKIISFGYFGSFWGYKAKFIPLTIDNIGILKDKIYVVGYKYNKLNQPIITYGVIEL